MKRVRNKEKEKKKRANNIDRVEERQEWNTALDRINRLHTDFDDDVMKPGNSNAKKSQVATVQAGMQ